MELVPPICRTANMSLLWEICTRTSQASKDSVQLPRGNDKTILTAHLITVTPKKDQVFILRSCNIRSIKFSYSEIYIHSEFRKSATIHLMSSDGLDCLDQMHWCQVRSGSTLQEGTVRHCTL